MLRKLKAHLGSGISLAQSFSVSLICFLYRRRPKGTAFLKFKTADASDAAISAASTASGVGVLLKGRQLSVMRAVDKKSAKDIGLEKTKEKNIDHRNLYLAKVHTSLYPHKSLEKSELASTNIDPVLTSTGRSDP